MSNFIPFMAQCLNHPLRLAIVMTKICPDVGQLSLFFLLCSSEAGQIYLQTLVKNPKFLKELRNTFAWRANSKQCYNELVEVLLAEVLSFRIPLTAKKGSHSVLSILLNSGERGQELLVSILSCPHFLKTFREEYAKIDKNNKDDSVVLFKKLNEAEIENLTRCFELAESACLKAIAEPSPPPAPLEKAEPVPVMPPQLTLNQAGGVQSFTLELKPADNSCGFHALGITRAQFVAAVLPHRSEPQYRAELAKEIINFVVGPGYSATFATNMGIDVALIEAYRAVRDAAAANAEALESARVNLLEACAQDNVYANFVHYIGEDDNWLGHYSAKCYAMAAGLDLHIMTKIAPESTRLVEIEDARHASSGPKIVMFWTDFGGGHYDVLHEVPIETLAAASTSAHSVGGAVSFYTISHGGSSVQADRSGAAAAFDLRR